MNESLATEGGIAQAEVCGNLTKCSLLTDV